MARSLGLGQMVPDPCSLFLFIKVSMEGDDFFIESYMVRTQRLRWSGGREGRFRLWVQVAPPHNLLWATNLGFLEFSVLKFLKMTHIQPTWRGRLRHSKEGGPPYCWDSATCSKGNTAERAMNHRQVFPLGRGWEAWSKKTMSGHSWCMQFKKSCKSRAVGMCIPPDSS